MEYSFAFSINGMDKRMSTSRVRYALAVVDKTINCKVRNFMFLIIHYLSFAVCLGNLSSRNVT